MLQRLVFINKIYLWKMESILYQFLLTICTCYDLMCHMFLSEYV